MGRLDDIPGGDSSGETRGAKTRRVIDTHEGATLHLVSSGEGEGDGNDGKAPKASETPEAISGASHDNAVNNPEGETGYGYINSYIQQLSVYTQGDVLSEAAWARILQTIDQVKNEETGIDMATVGSILGKKLEQIMEIKRGYIQKGKDSLFGTSEIRNRFEELDMLLGYKILLPIIRTTEEIGKMEQMGQKAFLSLVRNVKSPVIIQLQSGRYLSIAHSANSIYMIRGLDDMNRNDFTTSSGNEVITFPEFSSIATVYIDDSGYHTYNHHVHMNVGETRSFEDKNSAFTQDVETLFNEIGMVQSQDAADMGECLIDTKEVRFTHIGEKSMGHNGVGNVYLAEVNYQHSRYQLELTFYRDIAGRLRVYIGAFIGNGDAMTATILSILVGETFPILKSFVGKKDISLRHLGNLFRNARTSIQSMKLLGGIPLVVEYFRSKRDKDGNSLLIVLVQKIFDALRKNNIK